LFKCSSVDFVVRARVFAHRCANKITSVRGGGGEGGYLTVEPEVHVVRVVVQPVGLRAATDRPPAFAAVAFLSTQTSPSVHRTSVSRMSAGTRIDRVFFGRFFREKYGRGGDKDAAEMSGFAYYCIFRLRMRAAIGRRRYARVPIP